MSLTRRRFIETGSISLLATAVLPRSFASNIQDSRFSPEGIVALDSSSQQLFTKLIGESFTVSLNGSSKGSLTLISVTSAAPASAAVKATLIGKTPVLPPKPVACYSIRFQRSGTPLPQETYTLHNNGIGTFPLFIVPAGPGAKPDTYTAVFNHLIAS